MKCKPWCLTAGADLCFLSSLEFSVMSDGGFAQTFYGFGHDFNALLGKERDSGGRERRKGGAAMP